jgi:uncharacterized membrane protein
MNTKMIIKIAIVAAIYVVLTVVLGPISYLQLRVSEVLVLLCFYRKEYIYALIIGCFISNLNSPVAFDMIIGTFHTAVSVIAISKSKNLFIASLMPTIFMPIVGLELYFLYELPFVEAMIIPIVGEFIVVSIIGYTMFKYLEKNKAFMALIEAREENNEI